MSIPYPNLATVLTVGLAPAVAMLVAQTPAQAVQPSRAEVVAYHAGSLNAVMTAEIGPDFSAATG